MSNKIDNDKVILAFSGGLDTRFCLSYLSEQGYSVITVLVDTGGFDPEQIAEIKQRAVQLGAVEHITLNVEEEIYQRIIQPLIRFNALYENDYPLMCADRYVIAESLVQIAKTKNCINIAHGSTSVGNDQVRFDASLLTLAPEINIITPVRDLDITRDEEIAYLEKRNIPVDTTIRQYSVNENVFGITISGSEIDAGLPPKDSAYILTRRNPEIGINHSEVISIGFEKGLPVSINGESLDGLKILKWLNSTVGRYGVGACIYSGDCIIGIKGRIMFEAPGLFTLIEAHQKLEQYCLTKQQIHFNRLASASWTDLTYSGLYYEPLARNLEAYTESVQAKVCGSVVCELRLNSLRVIQVDAKDSIHASKIATYAQKADWTGKEANGFINMYSMQQRLANTIRGEL